MDEKLSWNVHVNHVISKISSGLFSIRVMQNILPGYVLKDIYFANVQSHLYYGISAWGPMINKSLLKVLIKKQERCVRCIDNKEKNPDVLFKKYRTLKLVHLIDLNLCKISFRYSNDLLPLRLMNIFEMKNHEYFTRNQTGPNISSHGSRLYKSSYLCKSASLLMPLNAEIKNKSNIKVFSNSFKKFLLDMY